MVNHLQDRDQMDGIIQDADDYSLLTEPEEMSRVPSDIAVQTFVIPGLQSVYY